ncbi:uncharacterized protein METZ01_LOCUS341239 [marine metagenome]|uniref:Uncharacterized protein n=1 Tax=marine metagenome TaxID=408172 RepID=A0A382QU52_9ZZZZ
MVAGADHNGECFDVRDFQCGIPLKGDWWLSGEELLAL